MPANSKRDEETWQKSATRVAGRWLLARDPLWKKFEREVYPQGIKNPDTHATEDNEYITVGVYMGKGKAARQWMNAKFKKWKGDQAKEPQGELVEDVAHLEKGQTLEWMARKTPMRGTVEKSRPNRAIIKLDDGRTIHMRPSDVEQLQPRVVG